MKWDVPGVVLGILSPSDGRYHWPHMMDGWWWMWILWIAGFFILALVISLLVYGSRNGGLAGPPPETPLDILKKRYASPTSRIRGVKPAWRGQEGPF